MFPLPTNYINSYRVNKPLIDKQQKQANQMHLFVTFEFILVNGNIRIP